MAKGDFGPRRYQMTQRTIANIMGRWRIIDMAICAFGDVYVVERSGYPVGNDVTIVARAIKMVGGCGVTLAANGGGIGKSAIAVTRFAVDGVAAIKGKEAVVNLLQKGDGCGGNVCGRVVLCLLLCLTGGGGGRWGDGGSIAQPINGRFLHAVEWVCGGKRPFIDQ